MLQNISDIEYENTSHYLDYIPNCTASLRRILKNTAVLIDLTYFKKIPAKLRPEQGKNTFYFAAWFRLFLEFGSVKTMGSILPISDLFFTIFFSFGEYCST